MNGREIGTGNGKRVPGNGKSGSEREGKRPFSRFRSRLGATLTGHHVFPCEERVPYSGTLLVKLIKNLRVVDWLTKIIYSKYKTK